MLDLQYNETMVTIYFINQRTNLCVIIDQNRINENDENMDYLCSYRVKIILVFK
jgi:hypothetical protein